MRVLGITAHLHVAKVYPRRLIVFEQYFSTLKTTFNNLGKRLLDKNIPKTEKKLTQNFFQIRLKRTCPTVLLILQFTRNLPLEKKRVNYFLF